MDKQRGPQLALRGFPFLVSSNNKAPRFPKGLHCGRGTTSDTATLASKGDTARLAAPGYLHAIGRAAIARYGATQ